MAEAMTSRERIWRLLHHREADRVGIMDSVWDTTLARWRKEGLAGHAEPGDVFGYDIVQMRPDLTLRFPVVTVEDTDEFTIVRNSNGALVKNWKNSTSTPGWLDHSIKTRSDWEEHKERARWENNRVDWNSMRQTYDQARANDKFVCCSGAICWDGAVKAVSAETLLYAMADDPAWVSDMFDTYTELVLVAAEELLGGGFEFDGAWIYDDMGYRNGTLFSPRTYKELIFPNDRRVCEFFKAHGMPVILHSCGQVATLIPKLIEAGYACLEPLEVKAGMDVVDLKKRYGRDLAFMGGIDVRAMSDPDPRAIEREIASKVPTAMQGGGYIYHSDHSVPDTVSLERYIHTLDLVRGYGVFQE